MVDGWNGRSKGKVLARAFAGKGQERHEYGLDWQRDAVRTRRRGRPRNIHARKDFRRHIQSMSLRRKQDAGQKQTW
jgi:hypothetical protein